MAGRRDRERRESTRKDGAGRRDRERRESERKDEAGGRERYLYVKGQGKERRAEERGVKFISH